MVKMIEPKASSTPKIVNVSKRRPIGDRNNSIQSPIVNFREKSETTENHICQKSSSEDEENEVSDDENSSEYVERGTNTDIGNGISFWKLSLVVIALLAVRLLAVSHSPENQSTVSINLLKEKFPSQNDDLWIYIEQSIKDIKIYHKPKTLMLLYNAESEDILERILKQIGEFATCSIKDCEKRPLILRPNDLQNANILDDYGEIIEQYKIKLEENGVMIIKNLDRISGRSAQAFHSFCDEYYPVVKQALFIFTLKLNKHELQDDKVQSIVEKYFYDRWKDIGDDKFYPLIARITTVVLPIIAES